MMTGARNKGGQAGTAHSLKHWSTVATTASFGKIVGFNPNIMNLPIRTRVYRTIRPIGGSSTFSIDVDSDFSHWVGRWPDAMLPELTPARLLTGTFTIDTLLQKLAPLRRWGVRALLRARYRVWDATQFAEALVHTGYIEKCTYPPFGSLCSDLKVKFPWFEMKILVEAEYAVVSQIHDTWSFVRREGCAVDRPYRFRELSPTRYRERTFTAGSVDYGRLADELPPTPLLDEFWELAHARKERCEGVWNKVRDLSLCAAPSAGSSSLRTRSSSTWGSVDGWVKPKKSSEPNKARLSAIVASSKSSQDCSLRALLVKKKSDLSKFAPTVGRTNGKRGK